MDGYGVATALGTGSLDTIARRLKCSRCGAKEFEGDGAFASGFTELGRWLTQTSRSDQ